MTTVANLAGRLNSRHPAGRRLPPLILMTDAARLPDPLAAVARLPAGAAVILRDYDAPDRIALATALSTLCRARRLRFLVAADARLAARVGADGLHLPEGLVPRARRRWPRNWLITAAAHSPAALWRAWRVGADAALLSPVFATASHPGAGTVGALRFAAWSGASPLPVYPLGGINAGTARRLTDSRAVGLAGIDGMTDGRRRR